MVAFFFFVITAARQPVTITTAISITISAKRRPMTSSTGTGELSSSSLLTVNSNYAENKIRPQTIIISTLNPSISAAWS